MYIPWHQYPIEPIFEHVYFDAYIKIRPPRFVTKRKNDRCCQYVALHAGQRFTPELAPCQDMGYELRLNESFQVEHC